jgi:DNA-directed RNA polymerase specialized sigma54-like protein
MVSAAEIVERRGARFLEAPFTGSKEAAERGELVYYIGGDKEALSEALPLLQASSKDILAIGDIGQATAIKVATNMVTAATVQASAEALALVQAAGLSSDKFTAAMQQNASYSKTLAMKLPKMVEQNFERHFSVQHMLKDMQIASRLGLTHHLELGVTAAARDRLIEQVQRGHGDEDYSAVARKYIQDSGPPATEADLELFQRRTAQRAVESKPESGQPAKTPEPVSATPPISTAEQPQMAQEFKSVELPKVAERLVQEIGDTGSAAEMVEAAQDSNSNAAEKIASVERTIASTEPGVTTAVETAVGSESALATLEAHAPAAPFINPVEAGEPAAQRLDQPEHTVAVKNPHDFTIAEASEPVTEDESSQARGFFSRLLRRANT